MTYGPQVWHLAHLTPSAQGVFTEIFYPVKKRGTHSQLVHFCQLDTPQREVILCSDVDKGIFRVITAELARQFLSPLTDTKYGWQKSTRMDMSLMNSQVEEKLPRFFKADFGDAPDQS